jgi:hypothetical protein
VWRVEARLRAETSPYPYPLGRERREKPAAVSL